MSLMEETPQQANTYIFNAESAAEMNRLTIQDSMLTREMGGLLPKGIEMNAISGDELRELCNQALKEMESPEFRDIWYHLSVWGNKSA